METRPPRLTLALGGGAARGLVHIGVLEVLEREGLRPNALVGSSMGGLIAALSAVGLAAADIAKLARSFRFPRWFIPGGFFTWERVFPSAAAPLRKRTFEELARPLAVTAVDLDAGAQVVLQSGPLLPAVRATCAVPGILPPEHLGGRWLVDGGLVNIVPVDVAWTTNPDVVVAVRAGIAKTRPMRFLDSPVSSLLWRAGKLLPNPASAKLTLDVLARAAEIALEHQSTLAMAMAGPEVLIEPRLDSFAMRDFHRLDEALAAGRQAAEEALPAIRAALAQPAAPPEEVGPVSFDPVCGMATTPRRARARIERGGHTYYFCSETCREQFLALTPREAAA